MNVGYVDESEKFFCAACWTAEAAVGRHPSRILDDEEEDGPCDNFWLVDECAKCRRPIKYMAGKLLT